MPYKDIEQHLEYNRKYYREHKQDINTDRNTHTQCECGGKYTKRHQARHAKTTKHIEWMRSKV